MKQKKTKTASFLAFLSLFLLHSFNYYVWAITLNENYRYRYFAWLAEVESSRTHFEVLGLGLEGQVLGLEASSPQKLLCPRLEDSISFNCWNFVDRLKKILEDVFYWRTPKNFFWRPFFWRLPEKFLLGLFFFGEHLRLCPWFLASSIPVLVFERVCPRKGCPWPRIFFCVLGLEPCVLDSTSADKLTPTLNT